MSDYTLEQFPTNMRVVHVKQEDTTHGESKTVKEHLMDSDELVTYLHSEEDRIGAILDNEDIDIDIEEVNQILEDIQERLTDNGG